VRANPHVAAAALLLAAVAAAASLAAEEAALPDERAAQPTDESTPIVDPDPLEVIRHIPIALMKHDFRAPEPVPAAARGYLIPLLAAGRAACPPATHGLMARDDGGADVVAVAYPLRPDDPSTALDLYSGS
jgi:hypothetical protein